MPYRRTPKPGKSLCVPCAFVAKTKCRVCPCQSASKKDSEFWGRTRTNLCLPCFESCPPSADSYFSHLDLFRISSLEFRIFSGYLSTPKVKKCKKSVQKRLISCKKMQKTQIFAKKCKKMLIFANFYPHF